MPVQWITAELLPTRLRRSLEIPDLNQAELAAVRSAQKIGRSTLPHLGAAMALSPFSGRSLRSM